MSTDVRTRFHEALADTPDKPLPQRLARATRDCLDVDGAALSVLSGEHRVAIGASDPLAEQAERLQFTLGVGPAPEAEATGRLIVADEDAIRRRWSPFAAELFAVTPFRSLVTLPLVDDGGVRLTLDLYLAETELSQLRLQDVATVGDMVAAELAAAPTLGARAWLDSPAGRRRNAVWLVVGRIVERFHVSDGDALDLLRARALSDGADVDTIAARITNGRIDLDELAS